jgi:hypothetical protein
MGSDNMASVSKVIPGPAPASLQTVLDQKAPPFTRCIVRFRPGVSGDEKKNHIEAIQAKLAGQKLVLGRETNGTIVSYNGQFSPDAASDIVKSNLVSR